jgi:membrane-bound lytic murein transglycosylase D
VESSHIVKAGECLSEIAVRYGTTTEAIRKANNMKSDRIVAGHKLVVPGKPKEASVRTETPAAAPSPIAVRQPAPQPVAVKPAPGPMPSALASPVNKPGPSRETPKDTPVRKPTADPVVTSAQKPATTYPAPAELQIMTIHDVQANEDIAGVAMTYGVKAEEIRKLNDLGQDPIRPGQRLKIPIPSVAQ